MKKHMIVVMLLIFSFYFIAAFPPPIHAADLTLSVGNGSGLPDSSNNVVKVNWDNPSDIVKDLQMDICNVDGYLTCSSCELTVRSEDEGRWCTALELGNGCCRVLLSDNEVPLHYIQEGSGPVITLMYDVAPEAPLGSCENLTLENVLITSCNDVNEFGCITGPPFTNVALEDGQFCFKSASSSIPTTSEWGVIIFMIIILGIGMVSLFRKRIV